MSVEASMTAIFVVLTVAVFSTLSAPHQSPVPASPPCIAADEPVYSPGTDGVVPPQLQQDKNAKNASDLKGTFSLELVVSSEGRVCQVRVLTATDKASARKAPEYIAQHWKFKPAVRQGKPVAVKFTANFNFR